MKKTKKFDAAADDSGRPEDITEVPTVESEACTEEKNGPPETDETKKTGPPETDADVKIKTDAPEAEAPDELTVLKTQCADYLDKLQRTMADFDNFRKRTIKEKASVYDDGVRETIEKLLPIIDNFDRAVASATPEVLNNSFYKGVSLIQRQLAGYLDDIGIEPADEPGDTFDPNRHFAVQHIEDESLGAGAIAEVLQKGYIYKNKVIRCSMVKVAN